MQPFDSVARLEDAEGLDRFAGALRQLGEQVQPQQLRDLLHGVPLGHPMHPMLVQAPLGAWISSAVLDAIPGMGRAARVLVGVGILSAVPAALSGVVDYSETHEQQQRVGVVHATLNSTALLLYARSWWLRGKRRPLAGRAYALAGLTVVGVSGFLGGHMAYRQAVGANHVEDVPHRVEAGWRDLGPVVDLVEGEPVRRVVDDVPLFVLRRGAGDADIRVLAGLCSHLAGPLHEGELADGCVVCPWHGSTFDLDSGEVVHGPATSPQPVFETRVVGGRLEVRLPGAG
jgi:nitrite reductase/ring-hydroxylating ferredoxin subunit/uncharacterized membrane protein